MVLDGQRYPYGQFIQTASGMQAPEDAPLKSVDQFKFIGRESTRVDAWAKSTGAAPFGIDAGPSEINMHIPNITLEQDVMREESNMPFI